MMFDGKCTSVGCSVFGLVSTWETGCSCESIPCVAGEGIGCSSDADCHDVRHEYTASRDVMVREAAGVHCSVCADEASVVCGSGGSHIVLSPDPDW